MKSQKLTIIATSVRAAVTVSVIGALASTNVLDANAYEFIGYGNTTLHADLTIESVEQDNSIKKDTVDISGDVKIGTYQRVDFDANAKLEAKGNVSLTRGNNTKLGTFTDGNVISGKNVFIEAVIQGAVTGGVIQATENLTLKTNGNAVEGVTLTAGKVISLPSSTDITDVTLAASQLNLESTLTVMGDSSLDDINKVSFLNESSRIENWMNKTVEFGELEVNGTGEAKLVNKSTADGVAFAIGKVTVKDQAQLAIYTDNPPNGTALALGSKIGEVILGKDSVMRLGWRGNNKGYLDSGLSEVGKLVLNDGSSLIVKDGANSETGTPVVQENADVVISQIEVAGNNASVGANLTGEETNITVAEGVTGASIAKISAQNAVIYVAAPGTENQLMVATVAAGSSVAITTSADHNTGNAQADLGELAKAVGVTTNEGTVNFGIGETDLYGALTGTLGADGQLTAVKQAVNTKTQAVADQVTHVPQMITRIMMNDVRKRMGDIRAAQGTHGVWARYNGGQLSGSGMDADFNMIQLGIDTVPVADAPRFGVAFSYARTEADATNSLASTDMDAYSLAFYGTKMYDNGMFGDVIGRMATVDADLKVTNNTGKADTFALSFSGELGWRFDLTEHFFIEPSVEATYTYTNADTFTVGSGQYELESMDSLVGRAGFAAGWKCPANKGDVYVRAALVHEFMGDVTMNSWGANGNAATPVETDGKDTYFEYAIGAQFNVNTNTYVYADVERTEGANLDEDWRANVGVRYAF